jgi:hypothetical protein
MAHFDLNLEPLKTATDLDEALTLLGRTLEEDGGAG